MQWICSVQCIGCYFKECALYWGLINDSFDDSTIALRARRNDYSFFPFISANHQKAVVGKAKLTPSLIHPGGIRYPRFTFSNSNGTHLIPVAREAQLRQHVTIYKQRRGTTKRQILESREPHLFFS